MDKFDELLDEIDVLKLRVEQLTAVAAETRATVETTYGLLWMVDVDTETKNGLAISMARKALLSMIGKDGQARGITAARETIRNKMMLGHAQGSIIPRHISQAK